MKKFIVAVAVILLALVLPIPSAFAQSTSLLQQEREGATVEPMSPEQLESLGDPLFNLVLKERTDVTNLAELEKLIKGDDGQEQVFVVSEQIEDPSPTVGGRPASRRAIITFSGENQGQTLQPNLMFSLGFNSQEFPNLQPIEALSWDEEREQFNYYKLDTQGTPGRLSWKFRNSSVRADTLSNEQRRGTCLQCHINGAPVMKELPFPWNNWHSFHDQADYLKSVWQVSNDSRIADSLAGADALETEVIIPAIDRFNGAKIKQSIEGTGEITEGKRLLRPLFATTEFNLISSREQVGNLHPFSSFSAAGPFAPVKIPNSFFLNANLIGENDVFTKIQGLGVAEAKSFEEFTSVTEDEYRKLVSESNLKLGGRPGDANFAWFVPEPSQVDNSLVDGLIAQGIVTPEFVAAVMAIDLETPIFSSERAALLEFVPDRFSVEPLNGSNDDLTQKVIAALERENPPSDSSAGQFLELLKSDDPLTILRERVIAYQNSTRDKLTNPQTRPAELKHLFDLAIARRRAVKDDTTLRSLDEFGLLFPLP